MLSSTKNGAGTSYGYDPNHVHAVSSMTVPGPVVGSFVINNGAQYTTSTQVTLNNVSMGNPTVYMASENSSFSGAFWLAYSTAPLFNLSSGIGTKTVYFKVKNSDGESDVKSDDIEIQGRFLRVTIAPDAAIAAGGQWSVDGGGWNNSGTTIPNLSAGSHTVHFKQIIGWSTPGDQSASIQDAQTTPIIGTYTPLGSLSVTILPQVANNAGALWMVDGGGWKNGGATVSNLAAGSHTVQFKDITGWNKPSDQLVAVQSGQTASPSFTYVQWTETGSLQVTISPPAAINVGALWRINGGNWQNSGAAVSGLGPGSYTVQFKSVTGWTEPEDIIAKIMNGQTTFLTPSYTQQTGTGSLQGNALPSRCRSCGCAMERGRGRLAEQWSKTFKSGIWQPHRSIYGNQRVVAACSTRSSRPRTIRQRWLPLLMLEI